MKTLDNLLRRLARHKTARWWLGPRPEGHSRQMAGRIAAQVGYPTSPADLSADGSLIHLSRQQAAHMLALAGTTSLAHGPFVPRASHVKAAFEALGDLSDDATFLSTGLWDADGARIWTALLTTTTFECGVIGYDAANAFIFWVEEED